MPKVSVIMGVYNAVDREIVKLAIDSILNQSFKNFEFIICDDGSTNNTYNIIYELIKDDSRCILIKNEKNQGLAQTLNNCLAIAKGEYIARMDADDISILTRLEEEVLFLDSNTDFALVSGWVELFENNETYGIRKNVEFPKKEDLLFGTPFVHPATMIRIDNIKAVNGYRVGKETLRAEDYDLWMRFYSREYKGYNIQHPILRFREDKGAYSRRKYKYRIDEAKVRYKGFKNLNLFPKGYLFVLKPLVVGLLPQRFLACLRREKY